ncbi:MAG TPA: TPM domain-containing protein, partial [Puia sp.]|nr:TPM domain-containing protein [Puia sp.]
MKKTLWIIFLSFFAHFAFGQTIEEISSKPPNPPRLVNDYAHVMTPDQVASLERKLVDYDDSTSVQIVVVTVQSLGSNAIDDAALAILRKWGVGNKKTNNGVVILAAIQDHKVFIATGSGMESSVPDITAKEIVENEIVPNFKDANYYRGFDLAADAIIQAAAGQYKAPEGYNQRSRGSGRGGGSILGIIIFVIVILILISRGGGGRGGMMNRTGFAPWIIASML